MIISDLAIRKPVVTVAVVLALVLAGLYSLVTLEVDEFPDIQNPIVFIGVPYPGASPAQVEREVVDRFEESIQAVSGVDRIDARALDGFAQIVVQFVFEKPVDEASQDVRDALDAIRGDLPPEIEEPIIRRFDPADLPIVSLTLSSATQDVPALTLLADDVVAKAIREVTGVAETTIVGGVERQLTVELDPTRLAAARVGVGQVVQALQAQNLAAPVGRLTSDLREQSIRLQGRLEHPEDFLDLVVVRRQRELVRLGQIATVRDGAAEARSLALFDGHPAVGVDVTKSKGFSTTAVADRVKAKVAELRHRLPPETRLTLVRDAGDRVRTSVRDVQTALTEGAALTVLVVFVFLNSWRSTVITGLALPISVISAFIAVRALGFTLNTMSLLGLSLAIGILIDDAIVVRENIVRHIQLGTDHVRAAHEGTNEIGLAVTATTFSIVAVFAPVAFMSGLAGQWFKPFALTIVCAVLVSLFVSFSLDPMLSAYWPDPALEPHQRRSFVGRGLTRFNRWFDRQALRYQGVVAWALDHRWWMVAIAVGSFVAAIALQVTMGGAGFAPPQDRSELNVSLEMPPGSNIAYARLKSREIDALLRTHPEVASVYVSIGGAAGEGGVTPGGGAVDEGSIYIGLVPKTHRQQSQDQIGQRLRGELRRIDGVTASVFSSGFASNRKQIQIEVRGDDVATIGPAALQALARVKKVRGAVDVGLSTRGQRPEMEVAIRRGLASALGITVADIVQALRPAFAGIDAGDWVDPTGETRDVEVRFTPAARTAAADLARVPLILPAASPDAPPTIIPLGQVAEIRETFGPVQIQHLDGDPVIVVGANVEGRSLSEVTSDIMAALHDLPLPQGARISQGGEVEDQREVFGRIFAALAFAVALMYLILAAQFGSFLDPLAIMLSLPLSLIGVVLALLVTGDTLNIMSLIGVILLMGIVAKNAILLIDFAKWAEAGGLPLREAIIKAGAIRLRPILMTTVALISGMTPIAIGSGEGGDFRAPLGRAVIGGTVTSTLLTLLVIPTIYEILSGWRASLKARLRLRRRRRGEHRV